jgi:hypothetical protein
MFQLHVCHGENQWDEDEIRFVPAQHAYLDLNSASSMEKNSPRMNMSAHSDTLAWFRANQSLLFLLNVVCLAEKQHV